MSYEIVKRIKIENGRVLLKASSNNVYPKYFFEEESKSLSNILLLKGEEALNLELLKMYEYGVFQEGNPNKWSRAIERLRNLDSYKKFNWRLSNYSKNCPIQEARESIDFEQFLLQSLNLKPSNEKVILVNTLYSHPIYVLRVTKRFVKYTSDKAKAKVFKYKEDALNLISNFSHLKLSVKN